MPRTKPFLILWLSSLAALFLLPQFAVQRVIAQTGGTCATPRFTRTSFSGTGNSPASVAAGDFNGDNNLDLAVVNFGSENVSLFLGNGLGGFGTATNHRVGSGPVFLATGDFNLDAKLDLVAVNRNGRSVSVLLGDGNGSFAASANYSTGSDSAPRGVAVRDLNQDGKPDLAVADFAGAVVLLGNGNGGFGPATKFGSGINPEGIAVGDFNGDAKPDLVVTDTAFNRVAVMLGVGDGSFGTVTGFGVGTFPRSVAVGEFNGDGKLDVAVANYGANTVSVLLGNGNGSFGAATNVNVGERPFEVAVGDFNLDGISDLVTPNARSSDVSLLLGNGNGSFRAALSFPAAATAISVATGDFNRDQKPDLAVAGENFSGVVVLLNACGLPKLEVMPTSLDFGTVNTGQTKDLNLTVRNAADGTLTVTALTSSNPNFSVTAPAVPFNVAAGAQQAVTVRFAPTTIGNVSGSLTLASNDPAAPLTVALTGVGSDPCAATIAPTSQSFPTLGGTGSIAVTIASGCNWTATSNVNWLSIINGASGTGNGTVNYAATANLTNAARTGTLTVAGRTLTVTQAGCSFTLATSVQSFVVGGGTGSVKVSTVSGCAWTAASNAAWLTITAGTSGSGAGEVKYTVAADPANGSRHGTLTIAGQTFTVLQGTQAAGWARLEGGTTNDLRGVHFLNESIGWVAGLNATLLRTANGGTSWSAVSNTGASAFSGFLTARLVDANSIWIGGSYVYGRTLDGGVNWRGSFWNPGVRPTHSSLVPLTLNEALAVGPGVPVRYSLDGNFTTVITMTSSSGNLNDIYAIDADRAWAVGDAGRIYRITEARTPTSFTQQTSGTTQTLNAVFMLDANTGWVVGNGGIILKTTNGGAAWTTQTSGTTVILRDVHFVNAERGWAVGDGGVILTTTNGGSSWTTEASGVTANLYGVHFVTANVGYIVGAGGVILRRLQAPVVTSVSGASYTTGVAADAIVSLFGLDLATDSLGAASLPLPTSLAGTTVKVKDSASDTRDAALFYVSPLQINYLIPPETKSGLATVTITSGQGNYALGTLEVVAVAPGFFTANQDGQGAPAGFAIHVKPNGEQLRESLSQIDPATMKHVPKPIDLGPENETMILELYGTGLRKRSSQTAVTATIGGVAATVEYADKHPEYVGLDQVNLKVPRALLGRGEVDVVITVDGKVANTLRLHLR